MTRALYLTFIVLITSLVTECNSLLAVGSRISVFYNYTYEYGRQYQIKLNSSVEYIFEYSHSELFESEYPARIMVTSYDANRTFPIFITARQQKGVLSWQLPLASGGKEMPTISRTLCPNKNFFLDSSPTLDPSGDGSQDHPIIHLYTSSARNLTLILEVQLVKDFYLKFNTVKNVTSSPAEPLIYFYSFQSGRLNGVLDLDHVEDNAKTVTNEPMRSGGNSSVSYAWSLARRAMKSSIASSLDETMKTVLIKVDSDDDICTLISIQNVSCPVFDTEREIKYEGFYATFSRRGGVTVSQEFYPLGFYIVLAVKDKDDDCLGYPSNVTVQEFTNFFKWQVESYDRPSGRGSTITSRSQLRGKAMTLWITANISYQQYWLGAVLLLVVVVAIYMLFLIGLMCYKHKRLSMDTVDTADLVQENGSIDNGGSPSIDHSRLDLAAERYGIRRTSCTPSEVADLQIYLTELCRKELPALQRRSSLYLWHVLTVAVFYGLPVVQLVITYQRVLNRTGDQDQCYYNFLCAHPLGLLSDFNHVYSNLAYVLLGVLFIIIVWRRQRHHQDMEFEKHFGIPQHHGLHYAMGVALMMEGILSASYHVCPNHTNFQFDTSFMYVMAVLCMVKIYQTRHPDINARAHATFGVLAGAVFVGLIGVLYPNFYFWLFFTILHILTCLLLTLQIYYMGRWPIGFACCAKCLCGGLCRPAFRARCVLVILANLCNWALAGYGLYRHSKDFASHLLWVFLMNLALHLCWYLCMKLVHRERPPLISWLLLCLAMLTWAGALYFFIDNSTSWALTPAQSRTYNKHCAMLMFYDNHDIWHMLSAGALFFSFMLMLTMDDDVSHVPRHKIPVF